MKSTLMYFVLPLLLIVYLAGCDTPKTTQKEPIKLWAHGIGSVNDDFAEDIAVDNEGNTYISGYFEGSVDFDPGPETSKLTSNGKEDIFLAKYDAAGNYIYAINMGGEALDYGYGVAVDDRGNAYITGSFRGTVDFDPGSGTAKLNSKYDSDDIFLAKYNAEGQYVYAVNVGGNSKDVGQDVAVDDSGNAYVTGYFKQSTFGQNAVDFDPGPGKAELTTNNESYDIFLAKYDAAGKYSYAINIGGESTDYGYSVAVDDRGNAYITGSFRGTADFDPGPGIVKLKSKGDTDIFLAKYNASGYYIYAVSMGGSDYDKGYSVAVDGSGHASVTGYFSANTNFVGTKLGIDFDPGKDTAMLRSNGDEDIFLAKYDAAGNYSYAINMGGDRNDRSYGLALDESGYAYITGYFSKPFAKNNMADFNPAAKGGNLGSSGKQDIFLAKYDQTGNYIYAMGLSSSNSEKGYGIAVEGNGNTYITGTFRDKVDFKPGRDTVNLISNGKRDIFLTRYPLFGNIAR